MSVRIGFCVSLAMAGVLAILGTRVELKDRVLEFTFDSERIPSYVTVPIVVAIGAGFGLEIDKDKIL